MQRIVFGPAVSSKKGDSKELELYLGQALKFSDEAIELSLTGLENVGKSISENILELLKKFKYKSIHLPVVDNRDFLKYPDRSLDGVLEVVDRVISEILPDTVLVHPDQVVDFNWLKMKYGKRLAFENMDERKNFGKTIDDLKIVFDKCPEAKLVLDVNHLWTNDKSMESAKLFFNEFSPRITHYHLSGYGGFHDALCISKEDDILKGICSLDYPIIDEGDLLQKGKLAEEFEYVEKRLSARF